MCPHHAYARTSIRKPWLVPLDSSFVMGNYLSIIISLSLSLSVLIRSRGPPAFLISTFIHIQLLVSSAYLLNVDVTLRFYIMLSYRLVNSPPGGVSLRNLSAVAFTRLLDILLPERGATLLAQIAQVPRDESDACSTRIVNYLVLHSWAIAAFSRRNPDASKPASGFRPGTLLYSRVYRAHRDVPSQHFHIAEAFPCAAFAGTAASENTWARQVQSPRRVMLADNSLPSLSGSSRWRSVPWSLDTDTRELDKKSNIPHVQP